MDDELVVREAERFLASFTTSDLTYRDAVTIMSGIDSGEYVCVATWGAAAEMLPNDEPEPWPVRLRVRSADGDEAEAYLSVAEAGEVCRALRAAMRRARSYPQPRDASEGTAI